ncbi:MAG: Holliday junction DNA helicase RuvA [Coxiella sp. RIFCSPHIGHO2_12_FULL_42_15]|nr:MAG: Holliday junction DNA helicase RuvA [Coxiella sp. RIFCSPHIGHO2_12_FULL_42_15]
MIGTLRGIITQKTPPYLTLDVNGVGYELQAPMTTFYQLTDEPSTLLLYTHLSIREDAHHLFGFIQQQDRDLFRALIKINGVGPKLALAILSSMEPQQFALAVQQQDMSVLLKIPGIGKKTAERLVIECRDALDKWQTMNDDSAKITHHASSTLQDAIDALTALGYKPQEAKRSIEKIYKEEHSVEVLIRHALKQMVAGKIV